MHLSGSRARLVVVFTLLALCNPVLGNDDVTKQSRERAIGAAYEKLAEYSAWPATSPLDFEIGDFEHLTPGQFDQVYYADLATLSDGSIIAVAKTSHFLGDEGIHYARYIPEWKEHSPQWQRSPEGRRMLSLKVSEVLDEVAAATPELREVIAITRYTVTVMFEGRSRTYKAAFLWLPPASEEDHKFKVLDHITQGLDQAVVEDLPTLDAARREAASPALATPSAAASGIEWIGANSTSSCNEFNQPYSTHDGNSSSAGHLTGHHLSHADFQIDCSCDNSCTSTCAARLQGGGTCDDTGSIWDTCHVVAQSTNTSTDFVGNGLLSGAECAAGFGCVKSGCLFCICGLSVSVQVVKKAVTFSTTGTPDWSGNVKASASCPKCSLNQCATGSLSFSHGPLNAVLGTCLPGTPDDETRTPGTPLVIDLAGDGFVFSNAQDGAMFDLDADGQQERIAWPLPGDDAFLVYDRNNNARIDDGGELFGDSSPIPAEVTERHGYAALSTLDTDSNGMISAEDAAFDDLWLWLDNGDGISQASELHLLRSFGVVSLDLDYRETRRRDRHGNELRFQSNVTIGNGPKRLLPGNRSSTQMVDVLLPEYSNPPEGEDSDPVLSLSTGSD